jgi:O6-methylguanine-DNA--protein-cysteine methyltransferase
MSEGGEKSIPGTEVLTEALEFPHGDIMSETDQKKTPLDVLAEKRTASKKTQQQPKKSKLVSHVSQLEAFFEREERLNDAGYPTMSMLSVMKKLRSIAFGAGLKVPDTVLFSTGVPVKAQEALFQIHCNYVKSVIDALRPLCAQIDEQASLVEAPKEKTPEQLLQDELRAIVKREVDPADKAAVKEKQKAIDVVLRKIHDL